MKNLVKVLFLVLIVASGCKKEPIVMEVWQAPALDFLPSAWQEDGDAIIVDDPIDPQVINIINALYPTTSDEIKVYKSHFDIMAPDYSETKLAALFDGDNLNTDLFRIRFAQINGGNGGSNVTEKQFALGWYPNHPDHEPAWAITAVNRSVDPEHYWFTAVQDSTTEVNASVELPDGTTTDITFYVEGAMEGRGEVTLKHNPSKTVNLTCEGATISTLTLIHDHVMAMKRSGVEIGSENRVQVKYDEELGLWVVQSLFDYEICVDQSDDGDNAVWAFIPDGSGRIVPKVGLFTFHYDQFLEQNTLDHVMEIASGEPLNLLKVEDPSTGDLKRYAIPVNLGLNLGELKIK